MQKQVIVNILKWGTVILLLSSIAFFFLPYRNGHSAFELIQLINEFGATGLVVEAILQWVVPVVCMLLAALMMAVKHGIVKCIFASVLCIFAVILTFASINMGSGDLGAGIIINLIIAIVGIVLPIVSIITRKQLIKDNK